MKPISLQEFQVRVKAFDGKDLETDARQAKFRLQVLSSGLQFVPSSSNKPRREDWPYVEKALERYAEINSFHPGDYHDFSRNPSYVLRVLRAVLEAKEQGL